jgi:hypothetical protein
MEMTSPRVASSAHKTASGRYDVAREVPAGKPLEEVIKRIIGERIRE